MTKGLIDWPSGGFVKGAKGELNIFMDVSKMKSGGTFFRIEQPIIEEKNLPVIFHVLGK